jgi:hypothetical protein
MRRAIAAAAAAMTLNACAMQGPPIQTASGQPEITLTNIDAQCVRSTILNGFVNKGLMIRTSSDTQIIAGKTSENFAANVLLGTRFAGAPEDRITALFIPQQENGLRVVISEQYVSNAGTGFEMSTPVRQSQLVQEQFEAIQGRAQMRCGRPN